jgi:hypothetical protein
MFTPMTRRALSAAQQEQERLGHAAVEPAHLLLALLKVRLEVGDWGHFFLVIFVSFYIFYVDVFFWFGLNQVFCFMGIRGWHEFWMVGRVGNGGCGMGATIVQPATSCEA